MSHGRVGIIGGSGLYNIEGLKDVENITIKTPFGNASDQFTIGVLEGKRVVFLPRHGRNHNILPGELNFRANIFGLKKLGVEQIIAVSAVGSMKEEIKPLDVVIPDQFIDRTRGRIDTFFGNGIVGHVSVADPVCPILANTLYESAKKTGATVHKGGTYLCMEGPQFSTRAESHAYRKWGVSVIGMTNLQEAKLAREAEMCYSTLALSTDYDCWYEEEEDVTAEMVIENLRKNVDTAKAVIKRALPLIVQERTCICANAAGNAIVTQKDKIPDEIKDKLNVIFGKYF
ncbi:MAG: S-methyl-5'-thioadenosine phosphorylase [Candidatus Scalindua sp.]|nr:S-methyl-5'-thioadenosine phosphorylase [Candidatus Scalindua sp.]